MLLRKVGTILTTEIKWGRIAGLAAGAALIAVLATGSSFSLLSLVAFSIAGIFVEWIAPGHPYWNSLFYSLLGVLFYTLLLFLGALGEGAQEISSTGFLLEWLRVAIVVVPQSLIGTWIGVSIRKFSKATAEARQQGGAAPAQKDKADPAATAARDEPRAPQGKGGASPKVPGQGKRKGR
jgi:hypothetical protein